jgi:Flp pilus assembly protein CpaB
MARPMTSVAVGRVNRRFLFLALILAVLSGILAYAALSQSGGGGTTSSVDISVVVAKDTIPAGTTITADMLEEKVLPQDAVGEGHVSNVDDAVGRVARQDIAAQEPLLHSKVVGTSVAGNDAIRYIIEPGQRGMAINVKLVTFAGGLVLPGDHVDVLWIPTDSPEGAVGAQLLVENVEVLAVQQTLVEVPSTVEGTPEAPAASEGNDRAPGSVPLSIPDSVTVTLMLTPQQAANVFCADPDQDKPTRIRLAVRQFGDDSPSGLVPVQCGALGIGVQGP